MNKKNKMLNGFRVKLSVVIAVLTVLSFNTQVAFAQTSTGQQPQKQTSSQTQPKTSVQQGTQVKPDAQTKVQAVSDPFNGKTYDVTLMEKGKTTGDKDKLIFSAKKFESTNSLAKGFAKADYAVKDANGVTSFTAKAVSEKAGTVSWTGVAKGDAISGAVIFTKPDKTVVSYSFKGTAAVAATKTATKSTN